MLPELPLFASKSHEQVAPHFSHYPDIAGFKRCGTSSKAAEKIEKSGKAQSIRNRIIPCLQQHGAMNADEIAAKLGVNFLNVRPRCSELFAKGKIRDSGMVRDEKTVWERHDPYSTI